MIRTLQPKETTRKNAQPNEESDLINTTITTTSQRNKVGGV